MRIIIATIKSWNIERAEKFKFDNANKYEVLIFTAEDELNFECINAFKPDFIFFPHWSWIIQSQIYDNFNCVVFHMTDLPFGRGGSPLQNLVMRGIENTKISALKVDGGMDTGEIYLKSDLNLNGTADEIFMRASNTIFKEMIPIILNGQYIIKKQTGDVVEFKRRKPEESELEKGFDLQKIYDQIRVLDGEGYPKAFIRFGKYELSFSRASLKSDKIIADVEIKEVQNE